MGWKGGARGKKADLSPQWSAERQRGQRAGAKSPKKKAQPPKCRGQRGFLPSQSKSTLFRRPARAIGGKSFPSLSIVCSQGPTWEKAFPLCRHSTAVGETRSSPRSEARGVGIDAAQGQRTKPVEREVQHPPKIPRAACLSPSQHGPALSRQPPEVMGPFTPCLPVVSARRGKSPSLSPLPVQDRAA